MLKYIDLAKQSYFRLNINSEVSPCSSWNLALLLAKLVTDGSESIDVLLVKLTPGDGQWKGSLSLDDWPKLH